MKMTIKEIGGNFGKSKTTANKSIAAIGAGRKKNQQQCISKLWFRQTEFYRSLVLNFGF
jgi:hypothetical protein